MMRRVMTIFLFLLAGAILNVAMAWGCVIWMPLDQERRDSSDVWPVPVPDAWPPTPRSVWTEHAIGMSVCSASGAPPVDANPNRIRSSNLWALRAGLPWHSLYCERHRLEVWTGLYFPLSFDPPERFFDGLQIPQRIPWHQPIVARYLPTRPLWPGFALNTLIYGALVACLCQAAATGRRQVRRKHGRCLNCGYDLRGDLDAGCPECGWNREEANK